MIIVVTELHVKSFWKFFPFIRHSIQSLTQAKKAAGCINAIAGSKGWRIGYTITAWHDKDAMQHFRNTGVHKLAMKDINRLASRYKTLVYESDTIPNWQQAKEKLATLEFKNLK